jgi:predicted ATPase
MLESMETLNTRLEQDKSIRLAIRVGIHTGLVVIGDMGGRGHQEQLALGETPNIASRIQDMAAPDTVLVSADTYRLVQGYFTVEDLCAQRLKGVAEPMPVYRVLEATTAQSRLDAASVAGLTPLVGRESEVALLHEHWRQSHQGSGALVLLSGEAGIGKSRLVETLDEQVGRDGAIRITFRCSAYHTNSAFYPIIEYIQRLLHFRRDDTPEVRLTKLENGLRPYGLALKEEVPLFAALLAVPLLERYPLLDLTPQRQKQKIQEALLHWLVAEANRQPVLAVWEDLHWADASTLEFLGLVIDQTPMARMFTLLTCRPEFSPPWTSCVQLTQLTLNRLLPPQIEIMLRRLTGEKPLPAEVVQQIMDKTDGVPLFVEELTKMVLESGWLQERDGQYERSDSLPPLAIPSTLHDSLMARLDRLWAAKEVAQLGATLGREFAYEVIRAVSQLDEATLQSHLAQLVDADLLYLRGQSLETRYVFKHVLIQEAAYQALLKSRRQMYHQQIAQVLETQFPETVARQPELLAHHYTEAGLPASALGYWQQAGEQARQRSANVEAIVHLRSGLAVLETLPASPERLEQELALQIALGNALLPVKGLAAPEVVSVYSRAFDLCGHLRDISQRFPALYGIWVFRFARADLTTARDLAEEFMRLAHHQQNTALLLEAHRAMAATLLYLGEFPPALEHAERGIALYDSQTHHAHALIYAHDPGVLCLIWAALALWCLGYPDQAMQRCHEALDLAREQSHPFSLALALAQTAVVHFFRGEVQRVHELAEEAVAFSAEQGFPHWMALGICWRGWGLARQEQRREGITQIRQGLTIYRATGAVLGVPVFLGILAEEYGHANQTEAGLATLAEAFSLLGHHEERFWEAELYRVQGKLLLNAAGGIQSVGWPPEACFHKALDLARRQQAKSWELRASTSLARLWQSQGKHQDAYDLLTPIYAWFTEGFDTADLIEAKRLLDDLNTEIGIPTA